MCLSTDVCFSSVCVSRAHCRHFRRHGKVEGRGSQHGDRYGFHQVTFPSSLFSVSLGFSCVGVAVLGIPLLYAFPPQRCNLIAVGLWLNCDHCHSILRKVLIRRALGFSSILGILGSTHPGYKDYSISSIPELPMEYNPLKWGPRSPAGSLSILL